MSIGGDRRSGSDGGRNIGTKKCVSETRDDGGKVLHQAFGIKPIIPCNEIDIREVLKEMVNDYPRLNRLQKALKNPK